MYLLKTRPEPRWMYLAGGCFWGMEAYYRAIPGVLDTEVGYANGCTAEATYADLHDSGHAETLRIQYDANRIHLAELFDRFFRIIDPYAVDRQGPDVGHQYRTAIFYEDEEDGRLARVFRDLLEAEDGRSMAVQIEPLQHFIPAEEVHQNYLEKHPQGYCHIPRSKASERLYPAQKVDPGYLKDVMPFSYQVTQEALTERPFSSPFLNDQGPGIYVDVVNGQVLFSTDDQFDSGCGWPSFSQGITTDALRYLEDDSHGMQRVEVQSEDQGSHLGHVFDDGPKKMGGLRYCINGAALRFIRREDMARAGYARLLPYVQKTMWK